MASDGLSKKAKKGKCRMCLRVRSTDQAVKAVGEVHHGYATGHIWECNDVEDCNNTIDKKLSSESTSELNKTIIKIAKEKGRYKEYIIYG
ncbi:hypothetical protein [Flavobacterium sp. NRK1]|uniref:hypothetical protein n=1 Tax=Flavobacterium sp. NRK1 TaxID=2954929 RepID=UPI002091F103|nr:hypothetical protein [Flavobacterium sp. NRK1]MCO6149069.1 hypothetical protein [Flavobacterium sp. NRK1]